MITVPPATSGANSSITETSKQIDVATSTPRSSSAE